MFRIELPKSIPLDCPACGAVIDTEIQYDEDAGYCELDTTPCQGSDTCEVRMCEECAVKCFSCDLPCCEHHRTLVNGEYWCSICVHEGAMVCTEVA